MKSVYEVSKDDLVKLECHYCKSNEELYDLHGEIWCYTCLEEEKVDECE